MERNDNTRVQQRKIIPPPTQEERNRIIQKQIQKDQGQIYDADKTQYYSNLQDFYNTNFFGFGVTGNQTNYDPRTTEGQKAILSNFMYAANNVKNFSEALLTTGAAELAGQGIKWALTSKEIGSGAEAVVSSAPLSTRVTKITSIPKSEAHIRNQVPAASKLTYEGTKNGTAIYTQPKLRVLTVKQVEKARAALDKIMSSKGWQKVTHPNLQYPGYTNGKLVVSDLGPGNIGKDLLGRLRLIDFAVETVPEFRLAMQKQGGQLNLIERFKKYRKWQRNG